MMASFSASRMRRGNDELHEVELFFHRETDSAVLVSEFGVRESAVWFPKSQMHRASRYKLSDETIVKFSAPAWLLQKHAFI